MSGSLAITLPFNIVIRIPLNDAFANAYFPHFATILHLLPVQVLREQKLTK